MGYKSGALTILGLFVIFSSAHSDHHRNLRQRQTASEEAGIVFDEQTEVNFVGAVTDFTLDMTKELLREETGNLVISPVSMANVLALLYQGVEEGGITYKAMYDVLKMHKLAAKLNFGKFASKMKKASSGGDDIYFENGVFLKRQQINSEFKAAAYDFNAEILETDFLNPPQAIGLINNWVASKTKNKITSLLEPGSIDPSTSCVLTNAVYFKDTWKTIFDPAKTQKRDFYLGENAPVSVDFMHRTSNKVIYGSNKTIGAKWVKLPFHDESFSMVIILPEQRHGLNKLINSLREDQLKHILESEEKATVILKLPKFKINYSKSLRNVLENMGLATIFSRSASEITGILTSGVPLRVSDAFQKATMTVDEKGATAAAASGLVINTLSLASYYNDKDFTVDHPFLAIIVNKKFVPIFIAKINNPSIQ